MASAVSTARPSIVAAQLRLLLKSPFPIYAATLTVVLAMIILRGHIDPVLLYGWGAIMLAWQALRYLVWWRFRRSQSDDKGAIAWVWPVNIVMVGVGVLWGLFSLGFYQVTDFEMRVFMLFVVTSMMTGGSISFTAYLPAYYGYLFGATVPIGITFLWHGTPESLMMGGLTGIYIAVLAAMARAANRGVTNLIELQVENAALVNDLRHAKEAAEQASLVKSNFLANMSHELRTPLNAIIGFSDMIRSQLFGPLGSLRYIDYVGDINRSGHHLLRVVNDILDLSKLEAGAMELSNDEVDLGELVADCVHLVRAQAVQCSLGLVIDISASLPRLRADELRLKQIVLNLLSNAIKFSRIGGEVAVTAHLAADGGLTIIVRDNGIGMEPAEIKIALQPFRQIESSHARRYDGTGLGLPLAKSLVEKHGGTLCIESAREAGTTVRVTLPSERLMLKDLTLARAPAAAE